MHFILYLFYFGVVIFLFNMFLFFILNLYISPYIFIGNHIYFIKFNEKIIFQFN